MFKNFIASIRLAFALACVGASLVAGAQWLGVIPNAASDASDARRAYCEILALSAIDDLDQSRWIELQQRMQATVDRNEDLLSIGLRNEMATLKSSTEHHIDLWPAKLVPSHSDANAPNGDVEDFAGIDPIAVNLQVHHQPWGQLELVFSRPDTLLDNVFANDSIRLLLYFVVVGTFTYAMFIGRLMGLFSKTQVVPDRVRRALDTLAEGLLVLDHQGRIVLANEAFSKMIARNSADLEHRHASRLGWIRLKEDADNDTERPDPWVKAIEESVSVTDGKLCLRSSEGDVRIFSVNAAPIGGGQQQRGALATFRDITHVEEHQRELEEMLGLLQRSRDEITRKNEELEVLATQDALTGCLNRRAFFEIFDQHLQPARDDGLQLSCMMLDIDHFKSVNDTYGHHVGDIVLQTVSQLVRELYEDNGVVCRYGGEEFCVMFPSLDLEAIAHQAERLRSAIEAITFDEPAELKLTASLGVSSLDFEAESPQDMINQADACLYLAKRQGRNQVVVYNNVVPKQLAETDESEQTTTMVEISYQSVTALMSALSFRDFGTAQHSRRVADLCARVSAVLFEPDYQYIVEVAGLLHDIGKIGVPDSILLKPGKLTEREWTVMARHDQIGVDIISGAFSCPELIEIMKNHHAFYGGHGRDANLPTGQDIPAGARLLTIADTYDAITSDRPYRTGGSHADAIAELRRCAGTQFDPQMVEVFANVIVCDDKDNESDLMADCTTGGAAALRSMTTYKMGRLIETLESAILSSDDDAVSGAVNEVRTAAELIGLDVMLPLTKQRDPSTSDAEAGTGTGAGAGTGTGTGAGGRGRGRGRRDTKTAVRIPTPRRILSIYFRKHASCWTLAGRFKLRCCERIWKAGA